MGLNDLLQMLGDEVQDTDEGTRVDALNPFLSRAYLYMSEVFLLFSQTIPSQNLGFVDSTAATLEVTILGRDLIIHQSPTLLSSNRAGGTTGAVLWKISPLFAEWMSTDGNVLFGQSLLTSDSLVLETGCGIAGVIVLAVAPRIRRYIATDQDYVLKTLKINLEENALSIKPRKQRKNKVKAASVGLDHSCSSADIEVIALDWETSHVSSLPALLGDDSSKGIDAVIACDCIYNEALIAPFVQTCEDLCRLRSDLTSKNPTICIVAQQLRSPDVFEAWLRTFMTRFRVWRLPDEILSNALKSNSGFVVHLGILRDAIKENTIGRNET